ncbi:SURF1 family protein [Candidatus Thioglobus sp.]|nr:SURF1 family protein [Candidatus Thioglobus sp.]
MIKRSFMLPGVLITLTFAGLVSLGLWQLDRADEKRAIEDAIVLAQSSPAKLLKLENINSKEHYKVLLNGYFDSDKQFIYDNQIVNSNAGYYVLTPFVLNKDSAILVNRGFVPWYGKRDKLIDIVIDSHPRTIEVGLIKPQKRIQLTTQDINTSFPILIQSLDLDQFSLLSGYQFVPMLAQLDVNASNGFFRQWKPFYGSVDKHLGYALQWFLMAFVLLFISLRLLRKE